MPGYQVKQEQIAIVGAADLVIRSLLDRQQFADPLGEAERVGISSAAWPLFGLVWPSGVQMAGRLAARLLARGMRPGERILEVGCGLALASLVGHRAGADVTASDCHPLAGALVAANLRLNGLPPMKYRHGDWVDAPDGRGLPARTAEPALQGRFDLIIGSDVLYERDVTAGLAGFIGRHAQQAVEVWIVDPDRSNRPAFNRKMRDAGFVLREERLDCPAHDGTAAYKGRLLVYLRDAAAEPAAA